MTVVSAARQLGLAGIHDVQSQYGRPPSVSQQLTARGLLTLPGQI